MAKKNSDPDETEEETEHKEAAVLPAREAMTIISPSTGGGFLPDLSSVPTAEGATESADSVVDADASGSAEESTTSEDRSEHFESDDSASSQT